MEVVMNPRLFGHVRVPEDTGDDDTEHEQKKTGVTEEVSGALRETFSGEVKHGPEYDRPDPSDRGLWDEPTAHDEEEPEEAPKRDDDECVLVPSVLWR